MALTLAGGTVVDGSGGPGFRANVTVHRGRIRDVRPAGRRGGRAGRVIDVTGLVVAPGFIDMHAHSDLAVLSDPLHEAKVTQGVTLEVLGQDGLSYAPVDDATLDQLRQQLVGWNGEGTGLDWSWRTVGDYLDRVDRGAAVNVAYLVPHATVRLLAMGAENRPATPVELGRMGRLVADGMRDGAVGLSAGLTYAPGMYASDSELALLCEVVASFDGYYSPHHRSYGHDALAAYDDQIRIAEKTGVKLHLAHAALNYPENAGRAADLLALLDAALARGVDVSLDTYPYVAGCTYLHALLPSWVQAGGTGATLERLAEPALRPQLRYELEDVGTDGNHGVPVDWSTIVVSGVRAPEHRGALGRHIADLAQAADRDPFDVYVQLLLDDRLGTTCILHVGNEDNVRAIMRHPRHMVGSDAILVGDRPHPRAWGTFPRYLGHYAREEHVLGLEECVAHMTARPAARLGLRDRGRIAAGLAADIVCFDPSTVADTATYDSPRSRSRGIEYVLVNGQVVVDSGAPTGVASGRSVRRAGGRRSAATR